MAAAISAAAGIEILRLASEKALRDIPPHGQTIPNRFLRNLVPCRQEWAREENGDHRLIGAVLHLEAPGNRSTVLVQPAEDFGLGWPAAGFQVLRRGTVLGAFIFSDAEMKVRAIEADGQVTVEFADPVWLAGTGQLIGRTLDDGPENNLVPVIGEKIGQKLFQERFI